MSTPKPYGRKKQVARRRHYHEERWISNKCPVCECEKFQDIPRMVVIHLKRREPEEPRKQ